MNFALTYYCNLRCPYCFAKDAMRLAKKRPSALAISARNLRAAIAFLKASRQDTFRMIGGEPTLHPRFEKIYRTVEAHGFRIALFSNGVMGSSTAKFLSGRDSLVDVLVNIRHPREYSAADRERLFFALGSLGEKAVLSFRISRLDFDPAFLYDLIDRYRLRRTINWAISCPSLEGANEFIPLADHARAVRRMVLFSKESRARGITWFSDYGFIRCAFTRPQLRLLKENVGFVPETNCFPPVEVSPDLRVYRCYGMAAKTSAGLSLKDFRDEQELDAYFLRRSAHLKRLGALDKCFSCTHMRSGGCSGGCLVHVVKRLPGWEKLPALF
jgi:hypothetical protein